MIRLAISVEGQTEEAFVKTIVADHLLMQGVEPRPILLNGRGGNVTVGRLASEMANLAWNFDYVTSMVDFYGFRDKGNATPKDLEQRIREEVIKKITRSWDHSRVVPYVQQHEFEALLFSDVGAFAGLVYATSTNVAELQNIRSRFSTPEDVNDSDDTAPSKRILTVMPRYNKVVDGPRIAKDIGLAIIRDTCPRFDAWMKHLESLSNLPLPR